eukprot:6796936-Alexandrium_andersonii.AAC.1
MTEEVREPRTCKLQRKPLQVAAKVAAQVAAQFCEGDLGAGPSVGRRPTEDNATCAALARPAQ